MKSYFRIGGIDYGRKRIGYAYSDLTRLIVAETGFIINDNNAINFIAKLASQQNIKKVVIGLPLNKNNPNTDLISEIKAFGESLEEKLIKIDYIDESFSSKKSRDLMIFSGKKKNFRKTKGNTDSFSAGIILSSYLENTI